MRRMLFVFFLLALCLSVSHALGDGPIDPYRSESFAIPPLRHERDLSVLIPDAIETGEEITFKANVTAEKYYFCVLSPVEDEIYYRYNFYDRVGQESPEFTFVFRSPGEYWLKVKTDSKDYDSFFTVTGEDFLGDKINEIVAECPGGGEYETALWLHDYLTNHAHYDYSYSRYTAEGVLLDGFGVCDSYSMAYKKLLAAAGIQSQRVFGDNHAWNAVYLEGAWHNIDPTWDDPGNYEAPVSGHESHDYFGLPNSVMFRIRSHQPEEGTDYPLCDSFDCNYNLRNNTMPWHEAVVKAIESKLAGYEQCFTIDLPTRYKTKVVGNTTYYTVISEPVLPYSVSIYRLERDGVTYRDRQVDIQVAQEVAEDFTLDMEAHYALNDDTRLLISAAEIGEEAFMDTGASQVVLTGNSTEIEPFTFANMARLSVIHIPASVDTIADNAFSGCAENLLIVAPAESEAANFAKAHGYCLEITESPADPE